ncbi:telomere-protecting terminal protein Tpg [Streptomyces sp. NPDC002309]
MTLFGDGLDKAVQKAFTRPAPKSAGAQMRYLVKQLKGTKAVAELLAMSQRQVERYVKDEAKKPRPQLAARLEREVKARWQPQICAQARQKAATTGGIVIDTRARIGYKAPVCTTDQDRLRHLTVALPPQYTARARGGAPGPAACPWPASAVGHEGSAPGSLARTPLWTTGARRRAGAVGHTGEPASWHHS